LIDDVLVKILAYIEGKEFGAGSKLPPERILAEELGINRTSLREALAVLEYMRCIERIQGSGIYLLGAANGSFEANLQKLLREDGVSPANAYEVYEAVIMIESVNGQLAAKKRTGEDIAALRENVKGMEELLAAGKNTYKLDVDFHRRIALMARNTFFIQISTAFWLRLSGYARLIQSYPERAKELLRHHRLIVDAIAQGDSGGVENLIKLHYRYSLDFIKQHLASDTLA